KPLAALASREDLGADREDKISGKSLPSALTQNASHRNWEHLPTSCKPLFTARSGGRVARLFAPSSDSPPIGRDLNGCLGAPSDGCCNLLDPMWRLDCLRPSFGTGPRTPTNLAKTTTPLAGTTSLDAMVLSGGSLSRR